MTSLLDQVKAAILANQYDLAKEILDLDLDPNLPLTDGTRLLDYPEVYAQPKFLQMILEHGGNLAGINIEGYEEIINGLIPLLAYPNGITNLMVAAVQETPDKLLDYLAYLPRGDTGGLDQAGNTALLHALQHQRWTNAAYLVQARFNLAYGNYQGVTGTSLLGDRQLPAVPDLADYPKKNLVEGFITQPPRRFVSANQPLMEAIVQRKDKSAQALLRPTRPPLSVGDESRPPLSVFTPNYYGKSIVEAAKYNRPSEELQESLADVYLANLREISGLSGPHLLQVITINQVPCFLIGETHIPNVRMASPTSLSIEEFYRGLFVLSPVCIDFFLETLYIQHSPGNKLAQSKPPRAPTGFSPMYNLIDEYYECTGPQKTGCPEKYPHVRMHNTEIRRSINPLYNVMQVDQGGFGLFTIYLRWRVDTPLLREYIRRLDRLYDIFVGFIDGDLAAISNGLLYLGEPIVPAALLHQAYGLAGITNQTIYAKLGKQYQALPKKILAQVRLGLIRQYQDTIIPYIQAIQKAPNLVDMKRYYLTMTTHFGSLIADSYTLGRMFKSIYRYQTNFITVYVGSAHIENYLRILPYLGGGINFQHRLMLGKYYTKVDQEGYIDFSGPERVKWLQAVDLMEKAFRTPSFCEVNG